MNTWKSGLFALLIASQASAWATNQPEAADTSGNNALLKADKPLSTSLKSMPGIYRFTENGDMTPEGAIVNSEFEDNPGQVSIDHEDGELVLIGFLEDGQISLSLSLPDEEKNSLPDQYILSNDEFDQLSLQFVAVGDLNTLHQMESGYADTDVASRYGGHRRARRHRAHHGSARDAHGRIAGHNHNCVDVVKGLTHFSGHAGDGHGMANALAHTGRYRRVSLSARIAGMVCSWTGGWHHKGHTGRFDGHCFVPTYGGNCGDPGRKYHLSMCVAPNGRR